MTRLIDVLTDDERALKKRIEVLRVDIENLEDRKHSMEEDLAMLESDIEHAEQNKRQKQQDKRTRSNWPKDYSWERVIYKNAIIGDGMGD